MKTPKNNPPYKEELIEKVSKLKSLFSKSQDFVCVEHQMEVDSYQMIYIETIIDVQFLNQSILPKLCLETSTSVYSRLESLFIVEEMTDRNEEDLSSILLEGSILFHTKDGLLSLKSADFPKRQPEESALETSIRGPKDGFVEDLKTNISLVRRRINTPSLSLEKYTIGKRSKTKVALMYLEDVIDKKVLKEVQNRLNNVELDTLTSAYELESTVRDNPFSIFPSMDFTGRPDYVVQVLNQGRFAIFVDGNPTVSFAPVHLLLQTKSPEDTYVNFAYVTVERVIRVMGIIIATFLPGVWIAFSAFNIEQIPYLLLATISVSRFGLPFSAPVEMFIILFLFELFNEAGVRLPRAIGQTVAVLGGLIVGDAAIRAGLTSPTMLVVAAVTYISSFTLVSQSLSTAITVVRFGVLLLSTFFGLFGVTLAFILLIIYFSTLSTFGVPYLGSLAPISLRESIRSFLRVPIQFYKSRTSMTSPEDPTRGNQS
ncbi:spore germination protein [Halalkalibacter akibai]|uniref:Spore germination protein GerKA n=1 Tax=Halalkalibacter akibai (strain ATCC 43226 / DSM 21942 / CIP 109018 / JCM 9157 / 1139) TaxID=1236973 RepID=W4QYM0_HALA3|nr:spore germination protein [Halalkalibacter akibai]GAE37181.1 spore germination protein GerKA [Halalkalibacter akibai JCM 9157]